MLSCARAWHRMYQGGNMWAYYESYLSACRDVLGLHLKEHAAYAHWEQAAIHGGFRIMHPEICMVSDFPEIIRKDAQNRPHCADGPSHRWRDGWELYHWHGVAVSRHWIMGREFVDVAEILREENTEKRRAGMEIFSSARAQPNPAIGTLLRADLPGAPGTQFLRARCGTGREIVLCVPSEMTTALEAQSWTYNLPQGAILAMHGRTRG